MTNMHGRLDSKTVVVTGAGRGQGFTEAELIARAGATVLACDRHFPSVPDGTHPVDLDVTDAAGWKVLGERIDAEHGGVGLCLPGASRIDEMMKAVLQVE